MRIYRVYIDVKYWSHEYPEWENKYQAYYLNEERAKKEEALLIQKGLHVVLGERESNFTEYDYGTFQKQEWNKAVRAAGVPDLQWID